MRLTILAGAALAAASVLGCSATLPEFEEQRDRWTRRDVVWEDFVAMVHIHAVLKTEPFRRAYVKEYARLFDLAPRQQEKLLAAELDEASRYHVLFVALHTNEYSWNDLDPARGFWEVRLQRASKATDEAPPPYVKPRSVRRLDERNPTWRRLFPRVGDQSRLYELMFDRLTPAGQPLAGPGQTLELIIAGAPAQVRLSWPVP